MNLPAGKLRVVELESALRRIRHAYDQFMDDSCQDFLEGLLHQVRIETDLRAEDASVIQQFVAWCPVCDRDCHRRHIMISEHARKCCECGEISEQDGTRRDTTGQEPTRRDKT